MLVNCYMCEVEFEPPADVLKAWGDSGRSFDPTDWVCKDCVDVDWSELDEDDYQEYLESL